MTNLKINKPNRDNNNGFDWDTLNSYVRSKVPENVYFQIPLMTHDELLSSIRSLDSTKATGLDGIMQKNIKFSSDVLVHLILKIINISIINGNFPDTLKLGKILPIFKGGDKTDPSNYRPISVHSVISKLIEKHVTKHLFWYLNKYNLSVRIPETSFVQHSTNKSS